MTREEAMVKIREAAHAIMDATDALWDLEASGERTATLRLAERMSDYGSAVLSHLCLYEKKVEKRSP